jgi:hypothetical protein
MTLCSCFLLAFVHRRFAFAKVYLEEILRFERDVIALSTLRELQLLTELSENLLQVGELSH